MTKTETSAQSARVATTEQEQQAEQNAKKDEYFPICYLFDISQCRKL